MVLFLSDLSARQPVPAPHELDLRPVDPLLPLLLHTLHLPQGSGRQRAGQGEGASLRIPGPGQLHSTSPGSVDHRWGPLGQVHLYRIPAEVHLTDFQT